MLNIAGVWLGEGVPFIPEEPNLPGVWESEQCRARLPTVCLTETIQKIKNPHEIEKNLSLFFYSLESPLVKPNELIMLIGKLSAGTTTKIK